MKSLPPIFFILLIATVMPIILIYSCNNHAKSNTISNHPLAGSEITTAYLSVKTLLCNDCINTVRGKLEDLDGVISVEAFLKETDNLVVTFEPQKISLKEIKAELIKSGHQIAE